MLEELRDRLVEKIADIGKTEPGKEKDKKLKELLIKSFSLIKIKHIRLVQLSFFYSPLIIVLFCSDLLILRL